MTEARHIHHRNTLRLVFACFVFNALDAYSLLGIPLPWVGMALATVAAMLCFVKRRAFSFPGLSFLVLYVLYSLIVNLYFYCVSDFEGLMPPLSTTPYLVYVSLRFFTILSVLSFALLLWFLLRQGMSEQLKRFLISLGCIVSIVALYIYVAQNMGLTELPRTRVGTNGLPVEEIRFTYAFHRVLGTFREPSLLAGWLILPMFLAFSEGKKRLPSQILMSVTMLMTGSMTGICSSAIGFIAALIFFNPLKGKQIKIICSMLILTSLSLYFAQSNIYNYPGEEKGILDVLEERIAGILEGGITTSNRDFFYVYFENNAPSLFGVGLGNSNLLLTKYLNKDAVSSFLNIFFATLYSTGIPGLMLIFCFFLTPIYQALKRRKAFVRERKNFFLFAAYISYCAAYCVASEELSFAFVTTYALLLNSGVVERRNVWAVRVLNVLRRRQSFELRINHSILSLFGEKFL
jgi:hypothetical protein